MEAESVADGTTADAATDKDTTEVSACGCGSGSRCVEGECALATQLYISIGESRGGSTNQRVQASSRVVVRQEVLDTHQVLAENEECTADRLGSEPYGDTHDGACEDWGTISVTGPALIGGTVALNYFCLDDEASVSQTGSELFAGGQAVTMIGSGGAGFPPFSESFALQTPVNGAMGKPVSGAPLVATWAPNGRTER